MLMPNRVATSRTDRPCSTACLAGRFKVVSEHGVDGLHVPSRDAAALAERLAALDDDRDLLRRLEFR
jgi:hypothetical protein